MEQRDYLKKQIDRLGKILGKLLSDLTGLKGPGQTGETVEITDQILKNELGLDLDGIASIPADTFIEELKENRKLSNESLEKLAEILFLNADYLFQNSSETAQTMKLYDKCLAIYEYVSGKESTYSLERHVKMEKIRKLLGS